MNKEYLEKELAFVNSSKCNLPRVCVDLLRWYYYERRFCIPTIEDFKFVKQSDLVKLDEMLIKAKISDFVFADGSSGCLDSLCLLLKTCPNYQVRGTQTVKLASGVEKTGLLIHIVKKRNI